MRPVERIVPFMKWLEQEWLDSPDQRFGQLLINLGLVEDDLWTWTREISDYPIPHEYIREIQTWGTYGSIMDKHCFRDFRRVKIKDLDFDHIIAILETQNHISKELKTILEVELSLRMSDFEGILE